MSFLYAGEVLTLVQGKYADGNLAVQAIDGTGLPYAVLSLNLGADSAALPEGAFFLKDYSENAPLAEALFAQDLIHILDLPPVQAGFVSVYAVTAEPGAFSPKPNPDRHHGFDS